MHADLRKETYPVFLSIFQKLTINLLEYPIHATAATTRPSQKPSHGNISGTKRGNIDLLVSKQPENILNKKVEKMVKSQHLSNMA